MSSSIPSLNRRSLLAQSLSAAGVLTLAPVHALCATALLVANVTQLYSVEVARIEAPTSTPAVAAAVRSWPGKVAVGGGRYSMGGQVAVSGGLHLDMRSMRSLVWLRAADRVARVQAGMRWRDLQDLLEPSNLAVTTMQSYANFTIGGSVSVNAHGRYVGHGPVGNSVRALQLVLADGSVVEADRERNSDVFRAAIGGYGAVGVITEVELDLADNLRIERVVTELSIDDYVRYFEREVLGGDASVLHNADLLPPHFDRPVCVTWRKSSKPLTDGRRLTPRNQDYATERKMLWAVTEVPGASRLRKSVVHPIQMAHAAVKWLNCEASLDVAELEPRSRRETTYVLQEFFVPKRGFAPFAKELAAALRRHQVEALNISIRHSPADALSLLPWAKEDVFSFVLYFKQRTHAQARDTVGRWTRELIDLAIGHGGRYYLPYQLHATAEQFSRAYPEALQLRRVKDKLDPSGKFTNQLWARYL